MFMPERMKVLISDRTNSDVTGQGAIDVLHLPLLERAMAAFASLMVCWFAAALFILVPVLHFVLVPLALLGGIGAFVYKLRLKELRYPAEIKCPGCKARLNLKKSAFNWPMRETCNECRVTLNISRM